MGVEGVGEERGELSHLTKPLVVVSDSCSSIDSMSRRSRSGNCCCARLDLKILATRERGEDRKKTC